MMKLFLGILFVLGLSACYTSNSKSLPTIRISKDALISAKSFQNFLQYPKYLPLETVDSSVISGKVSFLVVSDYVYVMDKITQKVLAFDRQQGKYLRQIGCRGRGPEEYNSAVDAFYDLPDRKVYCIDENGQLMQYDVSGFLDKKIPVPLYNSSFEVPSFPTAYTCLDDSTYCAFYSNVNGKENKRLVLFSPKGEIKKIFPNFNLVDGIKGFSFFTYDGLFYTYKEDTYFKESGTDTLFKITPDTLIPHFLIDKGEYTVQYAERYEYDQPKPFIFQQGIWESDHYVYFLFDYFAKPELGESKLNGNYMVLYDKKNNTQETYRIDALKEAAVQVNFSGDYSRQQLKINPVGFYDGYFVASLPALDIHEYFGSEPGMEEWKNVKEEDNPVLVFWKLL